MGLVVGSDAGFVKARVVVVVVAAAAVVVVLPVLLSGR